MGPFAKGYCDPNKIWSSRDWFKINLGRSPRRGFLDHAFMLHCTILPQPLYQRGVRLQRARSLAAFNVVLLISVLEMPFNFQFDMQCAGNVNSRGQPPQDNSVASGMVWVTGLFTLWMPSYQYSKSYCRDKTILQPSYLHNMISYAGKLAYFFGPVRLA